MKLSVIAIAFLLQPIFVLSSLGACQVEDDPQNVVEEPVPAQELDAELLVELNGNSQQRAADQELEHINEILKLDAKTVAKISKSLKEEIDQANKRIEDFQKETSAFIDSSKIDRDLQKALLAKVREHVPDSKTKPFEAYVDSSRKLSQLADKISQGALILFFDGFLSLNVDQEKALAELLMNDWKPVWNDTSSMVMQDSGVLAESILPLLDQEKLREILNEQQRESLKVIGKFSTGINSIFNGTEDENLIAQIKQNCSTVMLMRITEMESMCGLNPKQVKILSVAQKGAISKVSQRWSHLYTVMNNDPNALAMDLEFVKLSSTPLVQQCISRKEWSKAIAKILTEDQLKMYQQREEQRLASRREVLLDFLASSFLTDQANAKMTFNEFTRFREMLNDELHDTDNFVDAAVGFFEIEDESFENSLSAKHWEVVKPMLHSQREMLEQMKTASKEKMEEQAEEDDE